MGVDAALEDDTGVAATAAAEDKGEDELTTGEDDKTAAPAPAAAATNCRR